jgi:DNA mismatch endonuclease, patch repair protein
MVAQRRAGTKPELRLRSALHRRGMRYRVDQPVLQGTRRRADIVFAKSRVAVEVRGCFWHACPTHGTMPRANRQWWEQKLRGNTARDIDTEHRMAAEGWLLIVVWEHEDVEAAANLIESAVRARKDRA